MNIDVAIAAGTFAAGAALSAGASYVLIARGLSFLQGQMGMVMLRLNQVDALSEKVGEVEKTQEKQAYDLNALHRKTREIDTKVEAITTNH